MNEYERIAKVIRFLDRSRSDQPDLAALARVAGLGPSHFHRLFSAWAGVTPKDFLQCLTLSDARQRLRAGQNILEASLESGLSGPGRLHDLCVTLEAASPGEIKSGGAGWNIHAGFAESPFGSVLIAEGPRGICHISFTVTDAKNADWKKLQDDWPRAHLSRHDGFAAKCAGKIFRTGADPTAPLRAFVRGTEFQVRVWRALLRVPPGTLVSYGTLARSVKNPSANRAVGSAVGANPLAYLIPCHRVIRETGVLGDYRWDPVRKRALIAWEGSQDSVRTRR
ncbi:MAG: methylated-DNA--[protein]-cysteine S-methyltransferase [Verrucomicrobiae bacterium]|nr:methylated-DNA--[protein]-cysteine S-methyltransferase [Verrucomicrobiae bacterium]